MPINVRPNLRSKKVVCRKKATLNMCQQGDEVKIGE
jgi:hypothetical protein